MKQNKTYLHLGVTLIVSACAVLMFYDTFFQSRVLLDFFDKLMSVLSPVIYGLVFAYLLAPIVDFFDRYIQKGLPKVKSSLVRGLSILVTWICVIALIYLMFSILIPELVDSTKTLADNFESYYKTVYNWVNSLVENQTIFSDDIYSDQLLSALNGYYDKLVKWVTDTVIPQAQVAIVAVTGGIWSVVIFLKNLLIGMMISVYLLARKESFENGEPIVKRVIATAGQTVDIDFNLGQVYVDGELLDEDYINDYTYREEGTVFPLTVPEGEVFLMGDNRNHSNDSRDSSLGTVDTRLLIGKAVFLVFPGRDYLTEQREFGRIGLLQ